jgi:hypothetical protein
MLEFRDMCFISHQNSGMVSSSSSSPNSAADQGCYAPGFTFSGSRHDGGKAAYQRPLRRRHAGLAPR